MKRTLHFALLALLAMLSPQAFAQKIDRTPRTVVMTAFAPEWDSLVHQVKRPTAHKINGLTFLTGTMAGKPVLLMQSAVSMVNAAMNTQLALDRFTVKRIVFSGMRVVSIRTLRSATSSCRKTGRNIWKSPSRGRPTRDGSHPNPWTPPRHPITT